MFCPSLCQGRYPALRRVAAHVLITGCASICHLHCEVLLFRDAQIAHGKTLDRSEGGGTAVIQVVNERAGRNRGVRNVAYATVNLPGAVRFFRVILQYNDPGISPLRLLLQALQLAGDGQTCRSHGGALHVIGGKRRIISFRITERTGGKTVNEKYRHQQHQHTTRDTPGDGWCQARSGTHGVRLHHRLDNGGSSVLRLQAGQTRTALDDNFTPQCGHGKKVTVREAAGSTGVAAATGDDALSMGVRGWRLFTGMPALQSSHINCSSFINSSHIGQAFIIIP